jgi:hypothetical protein
MVAILAQRLLLAGPALWSQEAHKQHLVGDSNLKLQVLCLKRARPGFLNMKAELVAK